jgi:hypothetical protein
MMDAEQQGPSKVPNPPQKKALTPVRPNASQVADRLDKLGSHEFARFVRERTAKQTA